MLSATEALQRLREGNRRFVSDRTDATVAGERRRPHELIDGQSPFAIVLGCSDSRVPAEIVFDQGLGDLFVIRVAGNIVAASQIGSVEFAAEGYGTRLVVVLGHTRCGAIRATLEALERQSTSRSHYLASIVERIRPAVETLFETDLRDRPEELLRHCVRANIRSSADHLRHGSAVLERLIEENGLAVVGAEYCLESGEVNFFDGLPDTTAPSSRESLTPD